MEWARLIGADLGDDARARCTTGFEFLMQVVTSCRSAVQSSSAGQAAAGLVAAVETSPLHDGHASPWSCGKFVRRELSDGHRAVNRSISAMRGPSERANAELKNWRILRKIPSSPAHASLLVNAVQTLISNG